MTQEEYEDIAKRLIDLRKNAGYSQEDLAAKLFVSRQAVSKWERAEALPDTENLIALASLYGVSLDSIVRASAPAQDESATSEPEQEEPAQEKSAQDEQPEQDEQDSRKRIKEQAKRIANDAIGVAKDALKGAFDVVDQCEELVVENEIDEILDDDIKIVLDKSAQKKSRRINVWEALPYPILVTVAFLVWGCVWDGWDIAWTLFITIPCYYSLIEAIRKRNGEEFAYPVLCAFIYCLVGMIWGYWHPNWIIFITVPLYYWLASCFRRK